MKKLIIVFVPVVLLITIVAFAVSRLSADVNAQTAPSVSFNNQCVTTLVLDSAPNGLSGFSIEVESVITGTSGSVVTIDSNDFPLSDVKPVQRILISGVDLGDSVNASTSTPVTLFSVKPCITEAIVHAIDDDNGNPIFPKGTVLTP